MRAREIAIVVGAITAPVLVGLTVWSQAVAGPADVTIQLFQFRPGTLEVKRGTEVTWTNQDTEDFGAFLASANPNLPKPVVAGLVKHHVITLKEVIDAQTAMDPGKAWLAARTAAAHMQQIADPLAEAIVKQFPDRYRG